MDEYLGMIKLFAGTTPPSNWALCNGSMLTVQGNPGLFALMGNQFGGDGRNTFALPNLYDAVPLHWGTDPVQGTIPWGQTGGTNQVTITADQAASHSHIVGLYAETSNAYTGFYPGQSMLAEPTADNTAGLTIHAQTYAPGSTNTPLVPLAANSATLVAGSGPAAQPHENRQPYIAMYYIICVKGPFPPRN